MSGSLFDLSGIGIGFEGLPQELEARLGREWAAFAVAPERCLLRLAVSRIDGAAAGGRYDPKGMRSQLDPDGASFSLDEGQARVDAHGRAEIRLVRGTGEREWFTLLNLFRACLAWTLPSHGGAMLHAAGAVVGERAFVLVGGEGAGKSTWAALAAAGGARVVSDDIVLVDGREETLAVAAAPLRSTLRLDYARGRWPLAGILFPRHGSDPARGPVGRLRAQAALAANLPFVADGVERDPRIGAVLDRLLREAPAAELTFARDGRFLELLRAWP
jgi:hypothetical protein